MAKGKPKVEEANFEEGFLEQLSVIKQGLQEAYTENKSLKQENDDLKAENRELRVRIEELEKHKDIGEAPVDSKIESVFQEKLDHFKKDVRVFYENWQEKHQENLKLEQEGNQVCQDLGIDNYFGTHGMEEAKLIDKEFASFFNSLERMELKEFITKSWDLQSQFNRIEEKKKEVPIPWDSTIISFIDGLPERVRNKEIKQFRDIKDIPESLNIFVKHRGFEIFLPKRGDDLKLNEFRILDEMANEKMKRRTVLMSITPGLRKGDNIFVKAGVYLVK